MPLYHIFIKYKNRKGEQIDGVFFNFPKAKLRRTYTVPFMNNKPILVYGEFVHPSNIERIAIFESDKAFQHLILPNGKSPIDEENREYIIECFGTKKVKFRVRLCTHDFITSPPKEKEEPTKTPTKPLDRKKKIFIVHGRDVEQALLLQKYLNKKLKLDAIMFDDLPDKGRTIIEQLEYIRDNVGYTIAIVTPDDVGCLVEDIDQLETVMTRGRKSLKVEELDEILDTLLTRPRQNVIFELGLFIGALGRNKVCYLLQKDVQDELSDLHGILHKSFDESVKEVFHEIADELKEG